MDFFGGLDLQAEETAESGLASTDGDGRRIPGRLVVGERDAVHPCRLGGVHDRRGTHFETRARGQTGMDVQIELHGPYSTKYGIMNT